MEMFGWASGGFYISLFSQDQKAAWARLFSCLVSNSYFLLFCFDSICLDKKKGVEELCEWLLWWNINWYLHMQR